MYYIIVYSGINDDYFTAITIQIEHAKLQTSRKQVVNNRRNYFTVPFGTYLLISNLHDTPRGRRKQTNRFILRELLFTRETFYKFKPSEQFKAK